MKSYAVSSLNPIDVSQFLQREYASVMVYIDGEWHIGKYKILSKRTYRNVTTYWHIVEVTTDLGGAFNANGSYKGEKAFPDEKVKEY